MLLMRMDISVSMIRKGNPVDNRSLEKAKEIIRIF